MKELNIYDLMKGWFDFCYENPEKINPNHSALYFFILSHCNRLGWKKKFGLPTTMAKEAIGIKSYNTYIKCLYDLVDFDFIKMVEKSKNQYSTNIIALSKFDKALDKALDKASVKHLTKQSESTVQSKCSIIIPSTNILINQFTNNNNGEFLKECLTEPSWCELICMRHKINPENLLSVLMDYCEHLFSIEEIKTSKKEFKMHFTNWIKKQPVTETAFEISTRTNQLQPKYDD